MGTEFACRISRFGLTGERKRKLEREITQRTKEEGKTGRRERERRRPMKGDTGEKRERELSLIHI